ncbi:MAG: hypothetical protein IPJ79_16570 [Bacteroidetes bacterium]|nr:hypothetical protein [Bacteroidota bacterium]
MTKIVLLLFAQLALSLVAVAQWIIQPSGISGSILQSVVFTNANTGYVVGNGGVILKTINGGASWTQQTSGTSNDLFEASFLNEDTGYAVGYMGTILKTTNGGINWLPQISGTTNQLSSVSFVDANTGYAAGGAFGVQTILKQLTEAQAGLLKQLLPTSNFHLFILQMPIPVLPQAMQALYLKQPMAEQPGQGKQLVLKYYALFFC